ncbi:MAG: hypothetical protein LBP64_08730 [Tannerella sp.]|nr:hypothetical protein [Tannerella sp.]
MEKNIFPAGQLENLHRLHHSGRPGFRCTAVYAYSPVAAQEFEIANTGTTLTGTDAAAFEINTAFSCTSIAAGGTATVSVKPKMNNIKMNKDE